MKIGGRYGVRRIKASLNRAGIKIGKHKARQLMREAGLKAIGLKKFVAKTTDSKGEAAASPNLLKDVKLEECAVGKVIIGFHSLHPIAKRQLVSFSNLGG